jgi:hypothetical protein
MQHATGEQYILLNDDNLVRTGIYTSNYNLLKQSEDIGLVVPDTQKVPLEQYQMQNIPIPEKDHFETHNALGHNRNPNGWYIHGKTEDWVPIPNCDWDGMCIFYGDDFIYHNVVVVKGKKSMKLMSDFCSHEVSMTLLTMDVYKRGFLEKEKPHYDKVIKEVEKEMKFTRVTH